MTTYSIDHAAGSTESVTLEVAPKSEMTLVSTDVDPKTGDVISNYVLASGDSAYPATVSYRVQAQTRGGDPFRRVVMTFSSWATSDDGAGVVIKKPITGSISFVIPANLTVELADLKAFVGEMFSFMYASVAAGTWNTGYLQKLLYGVPQVV